MGERRQAIRAPWCAVCGMRSLSLLCACRVLKGDPNPGVFIRKDVGGRLPTAHKRKIPLFARDDIDAQLMLDVPVLKLEGASRSVGWDLVFSL